MTGTKRTRVDRQRTTAISDYALQLFEEMRQLPCTCSRAARRDCLDDCPGCRRWWELHPLLRRALNEKMWHFPTISRFAPDRRCAYEPDSEEARYLMLERALEAQRRTLEAAAQPSPSPN